jgi:2-polyprenyl-6-hydroxyphenyl methylase/3-demethylubiquinone-9 3-methyltransferase
LAVSIPRNKAGRSGTDEAGAGLDSSVRFTFGKNWTNFLSIINEDRIAEATARLSEALGDLRGKSFLDVGSGSGIHSLAAVRLGASRVHSFDYDPQSVACTREMKKRFAPGANWSIEQGSVLDENYLRSLGQFDIVYSWGVLHHTGNMWKALELVAIPAVEKLMVAIYHDQGWKSRFWQFYKRAYNRRSRPVQWLMEVLVLGWAWGKPFVRRPRQTMARWKNYIRDRGMSPWYDVVDWAGGYPFEVAAPEKLVSFFIQRGFMLEHSEIRGGGNCNDFVFCRK